MPVPSVLGLHHAQVFCPAGGEAAARAIWVGQLGLRELPRPASLPQGGCWSELPGVRFEEVAEIAGWKRCYVFDPFGNKIERDQTE